MYSAHGCIWRMLFIVKILISVCSSTNIIGILHNDVILPCMANYTETYSYEDLVVLWSRDSGDVIHQFFYKKDQTKNQVASFRGRTQLFHNKFLKGNLSLLLKQLRDSDVGTYECLFFLKDMDSMTKKYVQLAVQEIPLETQNPRFKYSSIAAVIVGVILVSVILICIQSHSNRIRSNSRECDRVGGFNLHITGLARTQGEKYVPRTFLLLNGNYTNPDCAYTDTVKSEELFTLKKEELSTRRMLLTGEAGVGKTYFAKYLIDKSKHSGNNLIYKDILYLPFTKLNSFKKVISVNDLLNKKYKMFGHTLPHVQNNSDFLIILDGLDEFIMDLKADPLLSNIDSTSRLPINSLILKLLCKNLLPNTDVLITSRVNVKSELNAYFDRVFFLPEFTNDEIKLYFETFASNAEIAKNTTEYIQKYNLSSIVSLPILCTALCEASKFTDFANYSRELSTCSRLMVYPLQCYLRNISCPMGENHGMLGANDLQPNSKIPEKIKILVHQITKLSYENMISGAHKFKIPDYDGGCPQTQQLLKVLCEFYFRRKSNTGVLKYRHPSVRDLFAALYKIWNVQELEEITECFEDWIWGHNKIEQHLENGIFHSFLMGFSMYTDIDRLLYDGGSTRDTFVLDYKQFSFSYLYKATVDSTLLNLLHCIFEHSHTETKNFISKYIKSIKISNTPLTTLDMAAFQYSLENKRLNKLEIDLVGFKERNLLPLENIIRNSTKVKLHFSKYSEESIQVIQRILQHKDCAIKSLCFFMKTLNVNEEGKIKSLKGRNKHLNIFIQTHGGRAPRRRNENLPDNTLENQPRSLNSLEIESDSFVFRRRVSSTVY